MRNKVYLLGGFRSHIGIRYGIFKHVRPEVLGGEVLKRVWETYCHRAAPDLVICGNAVGPGGNIGRLTVLEGGLPVSVPALTLDLQCASGLAAIDLGAAKIAAGDADLVVAGGTESASLAPHRIYHENDERSQMRNPSFTTAQFIPGEYGDDAMLLGAERAAKKAGISREDADAAAYESHRRALAAREGGFLSSVILPLFGSTRDEAIRPRMQPKLLARAPRVTDFPDGILTAANACTMNDGAAFLALASEKWVYDHEARPLAEVVASETIGSDPLCPPLSADEAVAKLLARQGLSYEDIDAFEYNEAFAVISADFRKKHPEAAGRLNQWGGALAYGHPYGASGAEIMLHLLEILKAREGNWGVAAIPAAGGVGEAILVKRTTLQAAVSLDLDAQMMEPEKEWVR